MSIDRLLQIHKTQSLFLFGARGVGKSTLLEEEFRPEATLWIDLLDPVEEDRFARNPMN
jgi:putative ribosome biogenesis GTPase RsgA